MTDNPVKTAWLEVGDELEAIGLKLKLHLEQEASDDDDDPSGVFERLAQKIEIAIDAAEHAADDEAVRSDLRDTGDKLVAAMSTTFREAVRAGRRQING